MKKQNITYRLFVRYPVIIFLGILMLTGAESMVQAISIDLVPVAGGFSLPVDITHAGDDRLFVVEQRGLIKIIDGTGTVLPTPFLDLTSLVSQSGNERGLLGLVFHPSYGSNGFFYVNYTSSLSSHETTISRFSVTANPDIADFASETLLLTVAQPFTNHNAGDLAFGPDGYLYIPTGDGGSGGDPGNRAQNPLDFLGKMLRIDVDSGLPYAVPPSNPFVGDPGTLDEIWALGLRNPWRFSFDGLTGDMWIGDVGQGSWEEIDLQPVLSPGGENYGWRCYEGNAPFNTSGCGPIGNYTFPVFEYANAGSNCSVTGGFVYRGPVYPGMYGHYLFGDYCSGLIWSLYPDGMGGFNLTQIHDMADFELVSFGEDYLGELYVSGHSSGNIYQVIELSGTATPTSTPSSTPAVTPTPGSVLVPATGPVGTILLLIMLGGMTIISTRRKQLDSTQN